MSEQVEGKRLEIDIANPEQAALYPAHGWALNSQGLKLLWCPLNLLMAQPHLMLKRVGLSDREVLIRSGQQVSFWPTFHSLVVCLRELHYHTRLACHHFPDMEAPLPTNSDISYRASEVVPLYVDLSFIYLRRIADRLAAEPRPLLFQHWKSVPEEFNNWISDTIRLESHKPLCDFDLLRNALTTNSEWFRRLRGIDDASKKKGVRDALEHRRIRMIVGAQKAGDERPRYTVFLHSRQQDVDDRAELLTELSRAVQGLCKLMEGIHRAVGGAQHYQGGDSVVLIGNDEDITSYWPEIGA
jgi:hypothetical protein